MDSTLTWLRFGLLSHKAAGGGGITLPKNYAPYFKSGHSSRICPGGRTYLRQMKQLGHEQLSNSSTDKPQLQQQRNAATSRQLRHSDGLLRHSHGLISSLAAHPCKDPAHKDNTESPSCCTWRLGSGQEQQQEQHQL